MGYANRHRRPMRTGRRLGATGAAVVLSVSPLATAAPAHADETPRTAVIGPMLDFFGFGTTIGAPVFCGITSATAGSGFQEFGASEQGNAVVDGINNGCAAFSEQGGAFVEQGKAAQAPYAAMFNGYANPAIGQVAAGVTAFGTDYDPTLSPFGPTIAGTGDTLNFLQGSPPSGS